MDFVIVSYILTGKYAIFDSMHRQIPQSTRSDDFSRSLSE